MHLIVKAPLRRNHDHVLKARLRLKARIDLFLKVMRKNSINITFTVY